MNLTNLLFETLKEEKCILHLKKIFGGADLADMSQISKFNKGIKFFCVLLIYFLDMLGLLARKIKKEIVLLEDFRVF